MISLRLSVRPALRMTQTLQLSIAQRLAVLSHITELRLALIHAIRDTRYEPSAGCPQCGHRLTVGEILKGFKDDPRDFTTKCPEAKCGHRFTPELRRRDRYGSITMPFYCPVQTLDLLRDLEGGSPEWFEKEHQAVYHSALAHFGSLKAAFAKRGTKYPFEEKLDAKQKVGPYLGLLPDSAIAACANLSVRVVRAMRRAADIPPFSRRRLAESLA